jgi:hypothetical protein
MNNPPKEHIQAIQIQKVRSTKGPDAKCPELKADALFCGFSTHKLGRGFYHIKKIFYAHIIQYLNIKYSGHFVSKYPAGIFLFGRTFSRWTMLIVSKGVKI